MIDVRQHLSLNYLSKARNILNSKTYLTWGFWIKSCGLLFLPYKKEKKKRIKKKGREEGRGGAGERREEEGRGERGKGRGERKVFSWCQHKIFTANLLSWVSPSWPYTSREWYLLWSLVRAIRWVAPAFLSLLEPGKPSLIDQVYLEDSEHSLLRTGFQEQAGWAPLSCLSQNSEPEGKDGKTWWKKNYFENLPTGEFFHTPLFQPFYRGLVRI